MKLIWRAISSLVSVCVRESARERECVCVRVCVRESVCVRERECMCVCVRERVCVSMCEREIVWGVHM